MIELLVVLFIVGVLAAVGGTYGFMPRQKPSVLNILSELEGLLADSHKYVSTSLGNIQINGSGSWNVKTLEINVQTLPTLATGTVPAQPARIVNRFRSDAFSNRDHAGVDDSGDATKVATTVGTETLLAALTDFSPELKADLEAALANSLFKGGGQGIQINAYNKQFLAPFCIPVVGLRSGEPYRGGPAGYIIVSGSRIYKFYKPGPGADKPWRRL